MHLFKWNNLHNLDIHNTIDDYQQTLNIIVCAYQNFPSDREFICGWSNSNISKWTEVLFDYYRKPNQSKISNYSLINSRLENKELNMNKEDWKNSSQIKTSFLNLFLQLNQETLKKSENITKILAPIVIMAEDYEITNRLIGIKCIHHFLLNGDRRMMEKMGLCDLFWKISTCSVTFENQELFSETWIVLHLLYNHSDFPFYPSISLSHTSSSFFKPFQNRYDELLEFSINEAGIGRFSWSQSFYLRNIIIMLQNGTLYAVTHLPEILKMLQESINTDPILTNQILNLISITCKPRIDHHREEIEKISRKIKL